MKSKLHNRCFGITAFAAVLLALVIGVAVPAQAQNTYTVLHSYNGATDGANPTWGLTQGTSGNLFGTASNGGVHGGGTSYLVTAAGVVTVLYSFCALPDGSVCLDGNLLQSGVVQSSEVFFYGVTVFGGDLTNNAGIVYKISPTGLLTILHDFVGTDGANPYATMVHGTDGEFYGSTTAGGTNGLGTIYKINDVGIFTSLHSFVGTDGQFPVTQMIQGLDGNFYGVTEMGGNNGTNAGTIFEITSGGVFTNLYNFCSLASCADGSKPVGALVQGTDGNFYGTTETGGLRSGGVAYRITPTGTFNVIYNFCSKPGCTDGNSPAAGLIEANDGNLYGTTLLGGTSSTACTAMQQGGCGTIFKLGSGGKLTTLYSFCQQIACADGNSMQGPLLEDTSGIFYGTTTTGGANGDGVMFSLSTGLSKFILARPNYGKAGNTIKILGNALNGASSVTFNGTPATFTVVQGSLISATVPVGVTTGKIKVVTPSGTISTFLNFQAQGTATDSQ
jgi:uncharacterized repeat protein (TIGR03803 family)